MYVSKQTATEQGMGRIYDHNQQLRHALEGTERRINLYNILDSDLRAIISRLTSYKQNTEVKYQSTLHVPVARLKALLCNGQTIVEPSPSLYKVRSI